MRVEPQQPENSFKKIDVFALFERNNPPDY